MVEYCHVSFLVSGTVGDSAWTTTGSLRHLQCSAQGSTHGVFTEQVQLVWTPH